MLAKEIEPAFAKDSPLAVSVIDCRRQTPHYHKNAFEFILCLQGRLQVYHMHRRHDLLPGDILQADTYDIHTISASAGADRTLAASIHIDLQHPEFTKAGYHHLYYVCSSRQLTPVQRLYIDRVRLLLLAILSNHIHGGEAVRNLDMADELLRIMRSRFQYFDHINGSGEITGPLKDRFERIMAYMLEHYDEKITMRDICGLEHISYTYLSRFFKESSLKTFRNFLHELRVYHSEHLLLCRPDLSVPDIGYLVGFSDPKFFYREFKKHHGHTPHQHRIWYREYNKKVTPDAVLDVRDHLSEIEVCISKLLVQTVSQALI